MPVTSSNIFSANIVNNILNVTGISAGSVQVAVCSASGGCSWLTLNVNGSTSSVGQLTFSQSSVPLTPGQTSTISIYGSGSYYISTNTSAGVANAIINSSSVTINAISSGSTNITVCQSGGQCGLLYVTVTTVASNSTTSGSSFLVLSQYTPSITLGQNTTVSILSGSSGVNTVAYNSNPSTVSASLSGNMLSLSGLKNGYAIIVVCDTNSNCAPVSASVGFPSVVIPSSGGASISTTNNISSTSAFIFTKTLYLGSIGTEVSKLQERLTTEGVYSGPVNGRFGPLTEAAVKKYQSEHAVSPTGTIGAYTRSLLNK